MTSVADKESSRVRVQRFLLFRDRLLFFLLLPTHPSPKCHSLPPLPTKSLSLPSVSKQEGQLGSLEVGPIVEGQFRRTLHLLAETNTGFKLC